MELYMRAGAAPGAPAAVADANSSGPAADVGSSAC
jgi:hypothetical protein